jgi:hypothetical protein
VADALKERLIRGKHVNEHGHVDVDVNGDGDVNVAVGVNVHGVLWSDAKRITPRPPGWSALAPAG